VAIAQPRGSFSIRSITKPKPSRGRPRRARVGDRRRDRLVFVVCCLSTAGCAGREGPQVVGRGGVLLAVGLAVDAAQPATSAARWPWSAVSRSPVSRCSRAYRACPLAQRDLAVVVKRCSRARRAAASARAPAAPPRCLVGLVALLRRGRSASAPRSRRSARPGLVAAAASTPRGRLELVQRGLQQVDGLVLAVVGPERRGRR